ncbi:MULTISPECIES: YigZ family protein [Halomonadaceae]|uniref:IMPACT family protein n=1 Tax=Vreelandella piezotolerans TaxID=2609667 RepID=A0ABQ6XCJ4_9GAMM|nr:MULTISPECIES: YigZ family protein [Halomonas]KAE8439739.1 IMPACT family protein [Halomonas piezotolerans]MCG7575670.1 YigZ family protein [Halomonas sp. MMH1-48]MCG7589216.1 YigZ family protein [Halomonas sp. McD50-5]MCG7602732.1 YigZ family protein [Halomonas sp. MM17-34]MCG7612229.1 YigZ family protein [Halomonas sp. MM17-29]
MRFRVPDLALGIWHTADIDVEKSQFLAWLCHAPTPDAFDTLLQAAKAAHPNASHHCTAFIAGPPGEQTHIGFSDDGEPGGTAGRPMFQALQGSQIGEIGCVVIRYFGGTKLGTGGLARAYAQAVKAGLETLPTREVIERDSYRLKVSFAHEAQARAWCDEQALPVQQADYDGDGVRLTIGWPRDVELDISGLENRLKTAVEPRRA